MNCSRRLGRLCLAVLAVAWTSPALAATAEGAAAVNIVAQAAGIQVTQNLTFQTQVPTSGATDLASTVTSSTANVNPASVTPASVNLIGGPANAVSLSVPAALDLSKGGQAAAARVLIIGDQGQAVMITGLSSDGTLSVDVGGRIALAGTVVQPGAYEGLLLVIAQYN